MHPSNTAKSIVLAGVLAIGAGAASAAELNIYTTREPGLIQPLLDSFKASTGITVNTSGSDKASGGVASGKPIIGE